MPTTNLAIFPSPSELNIGYSTHKKPTFATIVQEPKSGREVTGLQQPVPLWEFELLSEVMRDQTQNQSPFQGVLGKTEMRKFLEFWLSANGQFQAWCYQDPSNYSRVGQAVGVGTGSQTSFPVVRTDGFGSVLFTEQVDILDVRTGVTCNVYINGVPLPQTGNWWIDSETLRTLEFVTAPDDTAVITMDFSFFYLCRFIDDKTEMEQFMKGYWTLKDVKFRSTRPDPPSTIEGVTNTYTIPDQDAALTTPQNPTQLYFELAVTSTSGGRPGPPVPYGISIGFVNGSADLTIMPGFQDTNGASVVFNNLAWNKWGTTVSALQPSVSSLPAVFGVKLDTVAKTFEVLGVSNASDGSVYDISGITGSSWFIAFCAPGFTEQFTAARPGDIATLNDGSSAFVGTLPIGYKPLNSIGTFTWDSGHAGSVVRTNGTLTTSLGVALSGADLTADINTSGDFNFQEWFPNNWPAGTFLASDDPTDSISTSIYWTPDPKSSGSLNPPPVLLSWYSAVVAVRSNLSIPHS